MTKVITSLLLALVCFAKAELELNATALQRRQESACIQTFDFDESAVITTGQKVFSPDIDDLFLVQSGDGNFAVVEDNVVLWSSGISEESLGDYWSELTESGYIATYKGEPNDRDELVWTSASTSGASDTFWVWKPNDDSTEDGAKIPIWRSSDFGTRSSASYFFGLDCQHRYVAIFEGTPDDPGGWIWRQRILTSESPTESPTFEPTESPTFAPTASEFDSTESPDPPFAFYVMGDVPYSPWDKEVLEYQIDTMNYYIHPGASFTVHVGDYNKPDDTKCSREHFEKVYDILWNGPLPTFVLAGDNDFLDCPDKEEAWDRYLETFVDFEREWDGNLPEGARELDVKRWNYDVELDGYGSVARPEMFAFYEDGILFISLAILNKGDEDDEFDERVDVSTSWVKRSVSEFKDDGLRGIVLFSHAEDSDDLEDFFEDDLKSVMDYYDIDVPVVYICGDNHEWDLDKKYWKGFIYVQLDQGGCGDPLLIEVAPVVDGETQWFESAASSQYIIGDGLFRIDRQDGRYDSKDCD